jgi:ATP-dependent Lon protease
VGGIKEKVLAAKRAGIYEVILPEKNKDDLEDLTEDARKAMTFHLASEIPQVLEFALRRNGKDRRGAGTRTRSAAERRTPAERRKPKAKPAKR